MASTLVAPGLPPDFLQTQYGLGQHDMSAQQLEPMILADAELAALTFQQSILDTPSTTSRAGLYVYINCLLNGRPLFEDIAFINFLNARYKGDIASLITDLVLASFDVLANAIYRNESTESLFLLRSYLVNKLPVFLLNYADLLYTPFSVEYCIAQALGRVDPAAFPSFNQMFDLAGSSATLSEARQEFLFACALHQLIPEQSIEVLLGDVPMQSLPASGRYIKDELVAHCRVNPGRVEELIDEIENMEGNAGEIAAALIEIINSLCATNDSMTLKNICNALSRRKKALDIIMLFAQPISLLQPLCQVLDRWQEHEDQGEHQPVYDEFGSILLIVAVIQHRYDLQVHDLGFVTTDSFIFKYIQNASDSRPPSNLSEHESHLLGNWIRGLFETEGINDELMRTCSPKDFHLLIATLFDQSLKACQAGILPMETLKGGFEYLLEPFLLPSLTAGLSYFAHLLWRTTPKSPATDTLLPTLHTLLKPRSISNDSATMHNALLSIVAKPLESSILHAQRQHPLRADIQPLLDTLKPHLQDHRHSTPSYSELERWCATPGGGLSTSLRQTIQALTQWSSGTAPDTLPTNYTHQQLLCAIRIHGANRVLDTLLDEVLTQAEAGNPTDIILDIIVTMIAAPQTSTRLTLHDALIEAYTHAYELSQTNFPRAEMIVRIHRRVEAQIGNPDRNDATAAANDVLMNLGTAMGEGGGVIAQNAQGMPSTDIDDVLVESSQQIERQGFLGGFENVGM